MEPQSPRAVGLIGLGLMGRALGERLRLAGFDVVGHDVSTEARDRFQEQGGRVEELERFDFPTILLSLPNHEIVAKVVATLPTHPGMILIDTTTGDPEASRILADRLAVIGVSYLDATISGSGEHVRRGDAVLMVGGAADAIRLRFDLLSSLGRRVFHTGEVGSGAKFKLVTNLVLGLNRAAFAEGLAFAVGLGLDPARTVEILLDSPAASRIMETKAPKLLAGDYTPQAKLAQHLKDVRLMLEAADGIGLDLPLTNSHREILERAVAAGLSDLDNCALYEVLKPRGPSA